VKNCIIIAGGEYSPIKAQPGDFVIACDRGYEYALLENIVPDLLMGDFDSYAESLPANIPAQRFKKEKDDTDTMLAIRYAVEQGFDSVRICCGLGGKRLDHLFANIQSLAFAVNSGLEAELGDERTYIRTLRPGSYTFAKRPGWSLSLFSLTECCEGISLIGTKYELSGGSLEYSFPLGVSNEFADDAKLSFESGMLLLMCCRED